MLVPKSSGEICVLFVMLFKAGPLGADVTTCCPGALVGRLGLGNIPSCVQPTTSAMSTIVSVMDTKGMLFFRPETLFLPGYSTSGAICFSLSGRRNCPVLWYSVTECGRGGMLCSLGTGC